METVKIITVLACLIHIAIIVNAFGTTPIAHVLENLSDFYRDRVVFTSPGFFYGTCDQSGSTASERRCSLALETNASLRNEAEHLLLCNVTLQASAARGKIGRDFEFYALAGVKALLKWSNEEARDRYAIVDFSNCSVVYAKVDDLDIQSSYVAAADNNTIDVIVRNLKGAACRSRACKLTLDLNGNVVENIREWLTTPYKLKALMRSPSRGHLAVDYTGNASRTLRIYAIDDDGDMDIIKEYPASDERLDDAIEVSMTNQLLTACYAIEANVTCAQFDLNGTLKFERSLEPTDRLHSFKVHNVPGGGLIVISIDCSTREQAKCVPNYRSSQNWYFDETGEFIGDMGLGWWECPGGGFTADKEHFFVSQKGELCFSDLCPGVRYDKQLSLLVICPTRIDFEY